MNMRARESKAESEKPELSPEQEALIRAVSTWIPQFSRTLKTVRLYETSNSTTDRFREQLAIALRGLLDEHGAITLRFTLDAVQCEGAEVHSSKTRDDNLALPFHRDGVQAITFQPGILQTEVDAIIDAVVKVSGQSDEDDIVTLLWEKQMPHVEIECVPASGDISAEGGAEGDGVPWPTGAEPEDASESPEPAAEAQAEAQSAAAEEAKPGGRRSDDWAIPEGTEILEAKLDELIDAQPAEVQRFRDEYEAERKTPLTAAAIAASRAYFNSNPPAADLVELARFVPRVLRYAVIQGEWKDARESLELIDQCASPEWSTPSFAQEMAQPISITSLRTRLEQQDAKQVADFVTFAGALGDFATELLYLVVAELQNARHQKQMTDAIVERCRDNPERLAPWLGDSRPTVVRMAVQVLGQIGGPAIVGMLRSLVQHPDARLRQDVVVALRHVEPRLARPLLIRMLEGADTRMFCTALSALAEVRDPESSKVFLRYLKAPEFDKRPPEEKRAIYSGLGSSGGDEAVPDLEAELHKGNWFSGAQETHRASIARCLARVGTPRAIEVLQNGARSKRGPVAKACGDALAGIKKT